MGPLPAGKGSPWRLLHQTGREGPVSIPEGCHDEGPRTGCLQTREICSPMLPEVRSLESRRQQCMSPPKALGEAPSCLFQPWGLLAILALLGLQLCHSDLCVRCPMAFSLCTCVSVSLNGFLLFVCLCPDFSCLMRTPVTGLGPD